VAGQTTQLITLWQAGDASARSRLMDHCCDRLRSLARRMLRRYPHVARFEETGDVLQQAMMRLCRSLEAVTLESGQHFWNLATTQIRRELIDLVRHHYGPLGPGTKHETDGIDDGDGQRTPKYDRADWSAEPSTLAEWAEFHEQIDRLPPDEKEVVDLLFYQGMTQEEAAEVLGITDRTVRRRWVSARTRLHDVLSKEESEE